MDVTLKKSSWFLEEVMMQIPQMMNELEMSISNAIYRLSLVAEMTL